jgi:hypothetical protein
MAFGALNPKAFLNLLAKFQLPKFHLSEILSAAADCDRAEWRILKFNPASVSTSRPNLGRAALNFKISSIP